MFCIIVLWCSFGRSLNNIIMLISMLILLSCNLVMFPTPYGVLWNHRSYCVPISDEKGGEVWEIPMNPLGVDTYRDWEKKQLSFYAHGWIVLNVRPSWGTNCAKKGCLPCVAWVGIVDVWDTSLVEVPLMAWHSALTWLLLTLISLECLEA